MLKKIKLNLESKGKSAEKKPDRVEGKKEMKDMEYLTPLFLILSLFLYQCEDQKCIPNQNYLVEYINSEVLFTQYVAKKEAQDIFDMITKRAEEKAAELKEIDSPQYSSFIINNFGKSGRIIKINKELTKIIIDTINANLEAYCKFRKLDFFLDTRDTTIVFYNEDKYNLKGVSALKRKKLTFKYGICDFTKHNDVTEAILSDLNSKYESDRYIVKKRELIEKTVF